MTEERRRGLRESEYKLRQIIETVPAFLWSTGLDGEPTHVNQRLLDYSGMRFEEFKRVGWEAFVHADNFPETARAFHHAIHNGTSYQGVLRLRRADGEFRWHHARCEPLRDRLKNSASRLRRLCDPLLNRGCLFIHHCCRVLGWNAGQHSVGRSRKFAERSIRRRVFGFKQKERARPAACCPPL